jgi:hypothetical protein
MNWKELKLVSGHSATEMDHRRCQQKIVRIAACGFAADHRPRRSHAISGNGSAVVEIVNQALKGWTQRVDAVEKRFFDTGPEKSISEVGPHGES